MSIDVRDGRYFAAAWYARGNSIDFFAMLYRDDARATWRLEQRFRRDVDRDHGDWITADMRRDATEEEAVMLAGTVVGQLATELLRANAQVVILGSASGQENMMKLLEAPFAVQLGISSDAPS